jgi:hypothetical protein
MQNWSLAPGKNFSDEFSSIRAEGVGISLHPYRDKNWEKRNGKRTRRTFLTFWDTI